MDKYRIKHRWKEVGFGIKRCRRCKIIYCCNGWTWAIAPNGRVFKKALKAGSYYKRYHVKQVEESDYIGSLNVHMVEVCFVKEEDLLGKEVNCTEGMIADVLD